MTGKYKNKYRIDSTRLAGWDYRSSAGYFVTICTRNKEHYFGKIRDGRMIFNDLGSVACEYWRLIAQYNKEVTLGEFVIMPNHIHGIIILRRNQEEPIIERSVVKKNREIRHALMSSISPLAGSLSTIIRSYKSAVTRRVNEQQQVFAWQSRFHDHIIRDDDEFFSISNYIRNNPRNWKEDKYFTT